MSFLNEASSFSKSSSLGLRKLGSQFCHPNGFQQVRFATKRVSGSKTNKNDSAGRRLGPKVYEGHFVSTGQIIMRQRGTKIHPGENTGIGKDHTIYANEPGYIRFYYNPFHPLRKFVGVALKRDLELPTPHFEPRVRRFGYDLIEDPETAKQVEDSMSRKELLSQPEIQASQENKKASDAERLLQFKVKVKSDFFPNFDEAELQIAGQILLEISKLQEVGLNLPDAQMQTKFNYVYNLQLRAKKSEISESEFESLKESYLKIASSINEKVMIDAKGNLCSYVDPKERRKIQTRLDKEIYSLTESDDANKKREITDILETPGIFSLDERDLYISMVISVEKKFKTASKDGRTAAKKLRVFEETDRSVKTPYA